MNVRIRRYAEATNYAKVLTGVYNGIPKGENGMIIKYKNPARPIKYMGGYDKRGNMVLPVTNENGMNNVTLPEVTVTPRNINLAGAVDRPQLTGLTKGLYVNEAGTNTFMLIGNNMKSVSTDRGNNWTTSTLGEYTLTDLIYVDSNWYAIGSNGTKGLLLQNTASTFDQSNKILDLPDYSRQVIKINT